MPLGWTARTLNSSSTTTLAEGKPLLNENMFLLNIK